MTGPTDTRPSSSASGGASTGNTKTNEGRTIGPYRLIVKLGAGAMGEVWRALDTRLDRNVAIKLLPSALAADPERRARMLREAKAAAAVPHANVVTLFDIGSDAGEDYLVMELVEGRTVADLLRAEQLTLRQALDLSIGVGDALAAAHKRGILHRDVKAANVMVTREGSVKVLDFGLAKLRAAAAVPAAAAAAGTGGTGGIAGTSGAAHPRISAATAAVSALDATLPSQGGSIDETREGTMLGTPAYFSPEQVQGQLPDERSEIFSLGVLVYELVTGKSPFEAATFDELCAKILACRPAPLDAPAPLRAAVERALAFGPAERWPDMGAFAAALRAARDQIFAPPRRARWPWVLAAALFAATAAGGVAWWTLRQPAISAADRYLEQALGEYDVFYNDKAEASLKTAMRVAPNDPRPYAYLVLMGFADDAELTAAAAEAATRAAHARRKRDRALVAAAVALVKDGPAAARAALGDSVGADRELAFWSAELAWKAGQFDAAADGYKALLAAPAKRFRGRVFDHYTACLLYRDRVIEAVQVGEAYVKEYPGEADAIGVQATVYAAAGRLDEALRLAKDGADLSANEDTIAGLAKVRALRGEWHEAQKLYRKAIDLSPDYRRPLRRAALALLLLMDEHGDEARAAVAPCLAGGEDANARTVSICLLVAGLIHDKLAGDVVPLLRARAVVAPPGVPYGRPDALAQLLEAKLMSDERLLDGADDLYLTYHLPFGSSLPARVRAAIRIRRSDPRGAIAALSRPLEARPADVPALLQLAAAQRSLGLGAPARETLERARATWKTADPDNALVREAEAIRSTLPSE